MSVINYYGDSSTCVCACGCEYLSRWKVRRNKAGRFRMHTETSCPRCARNWCCYRTTTDSPEWVVNGMSVAAFCAAAALYLHYDLRPALETDCAT